MKPLKIIKRWATALPKAASSTIRLANESAILKRDANGKAYFECLAMDGVSFRRRRQICLIDGGDSSTVGNVVGSVRNLRVERSCLVGEIRWAADGFSQQTKSMFDDGLLSLRLDSAQFEFVKLADGQKFRQFWGPADVVTRWEPMHCGLYPLQE